MNLLLTAVTDVGRERDINEDGFTLCPDLAKADWSLTSTDGYVPLSPEGAVIAVADGMGGAEAGEVASAIALNTVRQFGTPPHTSLEIDRVWEQCFLAAHEAINRHVDTAPETAGMGTTLIIAHFVEDHAHVVWCGDSRCYRYRQGEGLLRVSHDHSYVQQLVDRGELTADEALTHPENNIITRCLGDTGTTPQPDVVTTTLQPGDLLLLCSDGLCGYLSDSAIGKIVDRCYNDPLACQEALLQASLDAGGYDNITIAIAAVAANKAAVVPSQPFSMKSRLRRLFN